ncbi:hypothetical protein EDD17DRAFT_597189 [Pisolithus thermaeus]|nr:hypothetical protein EDD17DRAFT_597189 [Pisolithus thermaeus]
MSPQRMAIASLLCPDDQPRPAHEPSRVRRAEKPRTIDALLHPAPAPVPAPTPSHHPTATTTTTTTTTGPSLSQHRAMSSSSFSYSPTDSVRHSFPSPRYSPLHSSRPPFAGLQALVHVASEEHRRISTLDRERDQHRHVDVDYHRPHKRPRDSRSASPRRPTSPNTSTLPATPPPFQPHQHHTPRGRSTSTSGGSQHRHPQLDSQYSHPYVAHPTSRAAHPSTLSPLLHPKTSPLLSHTLPSPSRHPQLHSLLSQPQTPPQPTHHLPFHRDSGTPSTNSVSAPRMAGGISLLREDVPPPGVEISRYQEYRTALEQDLPYLQVQAHLPVQSPIPRLPTAAWDVRQDTPPKERTSSSRREHQPTLGQGFQQPWVPHLPTVSPGVDSYTTVEPLPQPEPLHVDQTGIPLAQQQSVEDALLAEQDTSLSCPCADNTEVSTDVQISADNRNTQDVGSVDQSAAKARFAQRWPTPHLESPIPTPPVPEPRDTPSPVEILANSPPLLPRESPPIASISASPHSETAPPEQTPSHPSSIPSPRSMSSPPPHTVQHEALQVTNEERVQVHEPETELLLTPVKNEKVEEEHADLPSEPMAVDDSIIQKPPPDLEPASEAVRPVTPAAPPAIQHSEPDLGVKLEGEGTGSPQVTLPSASRESSPTPSVYIKPEPHPEADNGDTLSPTSSPPEADYRSTGTFQGSYDAVGMDIDVDEELLSLVEDRPPARRVRTSGMTPQGRLVSRASAAITDEEPELDSALPPIQRMKKGERSASATAAKKRKQETTSKGVVASCQGQAASKVSG